MDIEKKAKKYLLRGSDGHPGIYDNIWCDKKDLIQLWVALDNSGKDGDSINFNLMFSNCEVFVDKEEMEALIEVVENFKKDLRKSGRKNEKIIC